MAAVRAQLSSSAYISSALVNHAALLDLFSQGVSGATLAKAFRLPYTEVMRLLGVAVDAETKGGVHGT